MNNSAKLLFCYLILSLSLLVITASFLLAISRLKKLISFDTFKILKNYLVIVFEKLILFFNLLNSQIMGEKAFHREAETGEEKFPFYSKFLYKNGQLLVIKCFGFPPVLCFFYWRSLCNYLWYENEQEHHKNR